MRLHSIRARVLVLVLVPLVSLIGVYSVLTAITASDALKLRQAVSIRKAIIDPVGLFIGQIQTERFLATIFLADPSARNLTSLTTQERKTSGFLPSLLADTSSAATLENASPAVKADLKVLHTEIAQLPALRLQIGAMSISITSAQNAYTNIVATGYGTVKQTILEMPDAQLQTQGLADLRIIQSAELLFQEQALFAGHALTGTFPASAHLQFAELVGERGGLVAEAMPDLDPQYKYFFPIFVHPVPVATLTRLENVVINTRAGKFPQVPPRTFLQAAREVATGYNDAGYDAGALIAQYGSDVARPAYLRLLLAGALGLLAIIVSIIISIFTGRGLVRELRGLKLAALDLADKRLPETVARLSAGEEIRESDVEVPFPNPTEDEIGQVRQAFNSVQRTAIDAAVGQARMREGIAVVFRNLARRSQSLLHRQLAMLDDLELRAGKPEELDSLFEIDHLTTRMRRHAEGLVVLAGDRPSRAWDRPVPLADVLRAAVAEVEDYRRIQVKTKSRPALAGRAVADVIHLLAEIIENAAIFSPPNTPVRVVGDLVARGFAVEIEDRGLGMTEEVTASLNAKLAHPPETDPVATEQLGLYVAARLARRHQIRITLRESPFGGTTAVVLIPQELVVSEESYAADPDANLASELAVQATGRHAVRGLSGSELAENSDSVFTNSVHNGAGVTDSAHGISADEIAPPAMASGQAPVPEPSDGARDQPEASRSELTSGDLPLRTPQANLAQQLRTPQWPDATPSGEDESSGAPSPDGRRDTFTALQRGWELGRSETVSRWPGITPGPSMDARPSAGDENGAAVWSPSSESEGLS